MKIVNLEVSNARTLENAMDEAIKKAEESCYATGSYVPTHKVDRITFKTLVAEPTYRDTNFVYHFQAELEEL